MVSDHETRLKSTKFPVFSQLSGYLRSRRVRSRLPSPPRTHALNEISCYPPNTRAFARANRPACSLCKEERPVRGSLGPFCLWGPERRFPERGEGTARDSVRVRCDRLGCLARLTASIDTLDDKSRLITEAQAAADCPTYRIACARLYLLRFSPLNLRLDREVQS
jgi:hypothetical protein